MNALEQSLGGSLRGNPDRFYFKFHDGMYNARPGDHLVADSHGWSILEEKLLSKPGNFPVSRLTAVQRGFCSQVERAGGRYWLLIQFHPKRLVAYRGADVLRAIADGTRSLTGSEDWGVPVPWERGKWLVDAFLARARGGLVTIH